MYEGNSLLRYLASTLQFVTLARLNRSLDGLHLAWIQRMVSKQLSVSQNKLLGKSLLASVSTSDILHAHLGSTRVPNRMKRKNAEANASPVKACRSNSLVS